MNSVPAGELAIRSSSGGNFSQTGQVDWVAFLRGTAEATVSILARLAGSGVDAVTILVAQKVMSTLRISTQGEMDVAKALSALNAFGSFGDALWFGFGVKHVVKTLAQSKEGLACIALCGALTESHSLESSAQTLSAYADLSGVPRDISPSVAQWKQLASTCSGCLAKSKFSATVRRFMTPLQASCGFYLASTPQDLAEALSLLAQVSTGKLDSVTFTGGPDCAWLGALGEWLLGLSVVIEDANGNDLLLGANRIKADPNVRIVFDTSPGSPSRGRLISKKSYQLKELGEMIQTPAQLRASLLSYRMTWEEVLQQTFGSTILNQLFDRLSTTFVTAIGSAACIYEHLVNGNAEDEEQLRDNILYIETSFGRGLLSTMSRSLPEVPQSLTQKALARLGSSLEEATSTYESATASVAIACECVLHNARAHDPSITDSRNAFRHDTVCIVALLELIIFLARWRPVFLVDGELGPSQSGIYALYRSFWNEQDDSALKRLFSNNGQSPLLVGASVYAGMGSTSESPQHVSAITHRGICFYLESLCNVVEGPESLVRAHVVPGGIELDGRSFPRVEDGTMVAPAYPPSKVETINKLPLPLPECDANISLDAIATDADSHVSFTYRLKTPSGVVWFPPAWFAAESLLSMGRIRCTLFNCGKLPSVPLLQVIHGEECFELE
ncbi:hypothetical protein IQ06DRAFT_304520 [Phaeosphaeriaceae sp. SRC1lsM3a]|nr:hypothetical protein IQ06DRAFT_304520 [Stagonospora sp. SRC1lsM3a]